jgi:hypothetical protein
MMQVDRNGPPETISLTTISEYPMRSHNPIVWRTSMHGTSETHYIRAKAPVAPDLLQWN